MKDVDIVRTDFASAFELLGGSSDMLLMELTLTSSQRYLTCWSTEKEQVVETVGALEKGLVDEPRILSKKSRQGWLWHVTVSDSPTSSRPNNLQ
jgi:hypothetical protein